MSLITSTQDIVQGLSDNGLNQLSADSLEPLLTLASDSQWVPLSAPARVSVCLKETVIDRSFISRHPIASVNNAILGSHCVRASPFLVLFN